MPAPSGIIELAAKFAAGRNSFVAFRRAFLSGGDDCPSPWFHKEWSDRILHGTRHYACEGFRESGKSEIVFRANLIHALTFPEESRSFIVLICASQGLASDRLKDSTKEFMTRPELCSEVQTIVEDSGKAFEVLYRTGKAVRIMAFGKGTSIRGLKWGSKRPDLILIDDPQDEADATSEKISERDWKWFLSDVKFLGKDARIFLIGNNLGERCILERIMSPEGAEAMEFETHRISALDENDRSTWPERFPTEFLVDEREKFSSLGFRDVWFRERMCRNLSPESQRFRKDMFRYYDPVGFRLEDKSVYLLNDLASSEANSADDSVCMAVAVNSENHIFVLDCWFRQGSPTEHMDEIFRMVSQWKPVSVGIENVGWQRAMKPFLEREMPKRNIFFRVDLLQAAGKKELRIDALRPRFACGSVWFPHGGMEWVTKLEKQLLAFPMVIHDDLADTLAYAPQIMIPPRKQGSFRKMPKAGVM